MATHKTLYVTHREEWRDWLTKHGQSETEVWLLYYKKDSGRPRIPYEAISLLEQNRKLGLK